MKYNDYKKYEKRRRQESVILDNGAKYPRGLFGNLNEDHVRLLKDKLNDKRKSILDPFDGTSSNIINVSLFKKIMKDGETVDFITIKDRGKLKIVSDVDGNLLIGDKIKIKPPYTISLGLTSDIIPEINKIIIENSIKFCTLTLDSDLIKTIFLKFPKELYLEIHEEEEDLFGVSHNYSNIILETKNGEEKDV